MQPRQGRAWVIVSTASTVTPAITQNTARGMPPSISRPTTRGVIVPPRSRPGIDEAEHLAGGAGRGCGTDQHVARRRGGAETGSGERHERQQGHVRKAMWPTTRIDGGAQRHADGDDPLEAAAHVRQHAAGAVPRALPSMKAVRVDVATTSDTPCSWLQRRRHEGGERGERDREQAEEGEAAEDGAGHQQAHGTGCAGSRVARCAVSSKRSSWRWASSTAAMVRPSQPGRCQRHSPAGQRAMPTTNSGAAAQPSVPPIVWTL